MVFSAEDLVVWSDFPKGLRVLLLDDDPSSAADTRLNLEAMDYFGNINLQNFLLAIISLFN